MEKLEDMIQHFDAYKKRFSGWEASEIIIDGNKAFWQLKKPGSNVQKVCLYRDGCNMFVYGDYGQLVFDSMTWIGNPWNLQYDNFDYQMEKLSHSCREEMHCFDESVAEEQFLEWAKDYLMNEGAESSLVEKCIEFLKKDVWYRSEYDVEEFCEEDIQNCDYQGFLKFCYDAMDHMSDEIDWVSFLRSNTKIWEDYSDVSDSDLWGIGKCIHQRYFINMYAIRVIAEKLMDSSEFAKKEE